MLSFFVLEICQAFSTQDTADVEKALDTVLWEVFHSRNGAGAVEKWTPGVGLRCALHIEGLGEARLPQLLTYQQCTPFRNF